MTRRMLEKQDSQKEAMIMSRSGTFQPVPLDNAGEDAVEIGEWHGAAQLAEDLVWKHWGNQRADRLAVHHRCVATLISQQSWSVARRYDISARRKAAADTSSSGQRTRSDIGFWRMGKRRALILFGRGLPIPMMLSRRQARDPPVSDIGISEFGNFPVSFPRQDISHGKRKADTSDD